MSLLWDYEEKTHRIIAGRKRKRVQKWIVAAVNDGYEVESLTYSDGQYVALLVDSFSLDRARKKKMVEIAEEYTIRFKDEGFEHGLASAVHYIEGLRDLALGLSGPRLPAYDAYMDGFEQRETPLSDRVGAALTAIIRLECARIVGEAEAPKGPYRDRNLTRSQAGAYGQLLSWYYGWYDAKGQEEQPDAGLKDNQHYMEGWNQFRKLETQAARRLEYQRNRERNGIGEVKNPPVTAAVSPAEIERARTGNTDPGSEHPLVDPPPSELLAPAVYISNELQESLKQQGYTQESTEGILYRQGWGWAEQGLSIAPNNKGAFYLGYRAYSESDLLCQFKTRYNPQKRPSQSMLAAMSEHPIAAVSMDGWAYQNGWELAKTGADKPETDDVFFLKGFDDYASQPRSPEELRERITDFRTEQAGKETSAPTEFNIPTVLFTSSSTDDPVPPIPPPDIAPWLALHNLASGSKEERSYIHGWNRAAGGINPIPTGIDEWNDRGYQDYKHQEKRNSINEDEAEAQSLLTKGLIDHYLVGRDIWPGTPSAKAYREGWWSVLDEFHTTEQIPDVVIGDVNSSDLELGKSDALACIRNGSLYPKACHPDFESLTHFKDGLAYHQIDPASQDGQDYHEGWRRMREALLPGGTSYDPIPGSIDDKRNLGAQDAKLCLHTHGYGVLHESMSEKPEPNPDGEEQFREKFTHWTPEKVAEARNAPNPDPDPQSPPATEEPAEDVPLLAAFGSYRARRNIPPRSGRGNYYRNGWCDAADALQVSLNIPDDPENGLRLAYLAGYNDYQEAVIMSKESA